MKQRASSYILIGALMLVLGVASVVSAAHSQDMTHQMTIDGQAEGIGAVGCIHCGGDDHRSTSLDCNAACHASLASLIDLVSDFVPPNGDRQPILRTEPSIGLTPTVDPSPPKSILV